MKKHISARKSKQRAFYWVNTNDAEENQEWCAAMHKKFIPPYQKQDGMWVKGHCRELTDKERDHYILPPRNREAEKEFKKLKYKDLFRRDE